jgi:hypothetical protein
MLLVTVTPMLPLAAIAAWRTSAHAKRWQQDDRDGVAVAEATGCGVVTALLFTLVALPAARSSPLSVQGERQPGRVTDDSRSDD